MHTPLQDSPIIDFYPVDFRIDLNGKKYAWQGVALLPFVDEKRLLKCLHEVYPKLTDDESGFIMWLSISVAMAATNFGFPVYRT